MAKYRPIYLLIWDDPDFENLRPYEKLIFVYLFGNKATNESGVYPCTFKTIHKNTDVPIDIVEKAITVDLVEKVNFDTDRQVIWVKNFLKHNGKGNQSIIFRSILNDAKSVKTEMWPDYWKHNAGILAEYISKNKGLEKVISEGGLDIPKPLLDALIERDSTLRLLFGNSNLTLTKQKGNSNQTLAPITNSSIPITITNSSITKKETLNDVKTPEEEETESEIEVIQKQIDMIIETSNELFQRDGFRIDQNSAQSRNFIGAAIIDKGFDSVNTAVIHAEKTWYKSQKMYSMCHWQKLFRATTIDTLCTEASLGEPENEDEKPKGNLITAEQKMKEHQQEKEKEQKENEEYQLSSKPDRLAIVHGVIVRNIEKFGAYQMIIRDDANKKIVHERIKNYVLSEDTERSTVMIGINGIISDFLAELDTQELAEA